MIDRLEDPEAPWFVFSHYMDPHAPYEAPEGYLGIFSTEEDAELLAWSVQRDFHSMLGHIPELAQTDRAQAERIVAAFERRYDEESIFVDDKVRELIEAAEERSGDRPLWVIVTSDHGEHFLEHDHIGHGTSLYEQQVSVPLVIHGEGLHDREDLPDTLEQIGRFLYRAAFDDAGPWADIPSCVDDGIRVQGWHSRLAVRQGSWKLWYHPDDETGELIIDGLFDLASDPGELVDRSAEEPERVALMARLLAELDARMPETTGGASLRDDGLTDAILGELGYVDHEH
jgi:arylsulfatase A-like enzyme